MAYEDMNALNNALIRKALKGSLFVAPEDGTVITVANLFTGPRTVADGATTSASATLTSATASFQTSDIGGTVVGTGIPVGATIIARASATSVTLSANATATATGVSITVTPVNSLKPLPVGYTDGGYTTEEGLRFARATDNSVINSWQSTTPTRSNKTSDVETIQVDFQELNITTLGLYTGADLSAVEVSAAGTLSIRKPAVPNEPYFRLLAVAVDIVDDEELVVAYFFPRAQVQSYSDQAFAKGDNAINWGMTFTTFMDDALGYSKDTIFGGGGFLALATAMGFTVAS